MSGTARSRAGSWHRALLPRAGGVILGLVFLAAGILKALDPGTFLYNLPFYGIPSILEVPIVVLLPAAEIALGLMLVAGWRLRAGALGAGTLLVVFAAAIGWGWSQGTLEDCLCFGTMLIRSPEEALRQDLLLLAVAVMTALSAPPPRFFLPRRVGDGIVAGVGIAVALALAAAVAAGIETPGEPPAAVEPTATIDRPGPALAATAPGSGSPRPSGSPCAGERPRAPGVAGSTAGSPGRASPGRIGRCPGSVAPPPAGPRA